MKSFMRFFFTYIWVFRLWNPNVSGQLQDKRAAAVTKNKSILNEMHEWPTASLVLYTKPLVTNFGKHLKNEIKNSSLVPIKQFANNPFLDKYWVKEGKVDADYNTNAYLINGYRVQVSCIDLEPFDFKLGYSKDFSDLSYIHKHKKTIQTLTEEYVDATMSAIMNDSSLIDDSMNEVMKNDAIDNAIFKFCYLAMKHPRKHAFGVDWDKVDGLKDGMVMSHVLIERHGKRKVVLVIGADFNKIIKGIVTQLKKDKLMEDFGGKQRDVNIKDLFS